MTILVVGCSFVENLTKCNQHVDPTTWQLCGKAGSGNQAIAARTQYELSKNINYDHVVILWSGINRLDFPIGKTLHNTMPTDFRGEYVYQYFSEMGDVVWYHSGGWALSGCSPESPKWFKSWCNTQYMSATSRYLTDLTANSIIATQGLLESKKIPYTMSWIYDVDADYTNTPDSHDFFIAPGCGKIDRTSDLLKLIIWESFTKELAPYEYGRETNRLCDGFHPSSEAMNDWFKLIIGINLLN